MSRCALPKRLLGLPSRVRRSLTTSTAKATQYPEIHDLVCIGGGPAGLALALALQCHQSTANLKVALIDSQDLANSQTPNHTDGYSNRCSSLTPSSIRFLRKIGSWDYIDSRRLQPYHAMDVWDGVSGSKIHFDSEESTSALVDTVGEVVLGNRFRASRRQYEMEDGGTVVATMCENMNLTSALLQRLIRRNARQTNLEVLGNSKIESIFLGPEPEDEAHLNLSQWPIINVNGRQLAARLLVGADGANSAVRRFVGVPSDGWDYSQHGVVATLHIDRQFAQHELRTAYQRFLPAGPVALLPLPGDKASLVWSISTELASKLKQLNAQDFVAMINAAFRLLPVDIQYMLTQMSSGQANEHSWRESNINHRDTGLPSAFPYVIGVQDGTVASFPLRMRHASTYIGHRVALIGDAAHTIHPLAGQGLNLGLADAESLARQIVYGQEHGIDIGTCWCLDAYNGDRWATNNAMLGVVDKLQKLYSIESGPGVWSRSFGLDLVNRLGPLRGAFMNVASGKR